MLLGFYCVFEKVSVVHSGNGFRRAFERRLSVVHFIANFKTNKLKEKRSRTPNCCAFYQLRPSVSDNSTLLGRFLSMERELDIFLSPSARTSRFGVEGKLILQLLILHRTGKWSIITLPG